MSITIAQGNTLINGSGSATTPSAIALQNNATALLLPKWRSLLSGVNTNQGNAKLLALGDSTTFGTGSNNSNTGNLRPLSYPTQLAGMFTNCGVTAFSNSWMGDGGVVESSGTADSRIVLGSFTQLSPTGTAVTLGGSLMAATNNTSGPLTF